MADLVIDYELLYLAAGKLNALNNDISAINYTPSADGYIPIPFTPAQGENVKVVPGDTTIGPGNLAGALENFYSHWSPNLKNQVQQISEVASAFKSIAETFFDADAAQAAAINAGFVTSNARNYNSEEANFLKNLASYAKLPGGDQASTSIPYYDSNFNLKNEVVDRPTPPSLTVNSVAMGATTTLTLGPPDPHDPNHNPQIATETTSYTNTTMTYSETTKFGPDKGWLNGAPVQDTNTAISHSDGSGDIIHTVNNTDGSSSTTDSNISADGKTLTVTTSTQSSPDSAPVQTSSQTQSGQGIVIANPDNNPLPDNAQ